MSDLRRYCPAGGSAYRAIAKKEIKMLHASNRCSIIHVEFKKKEKQK